MTAAASRSLFNPTSVQFVGSLPSELNEYAGDVTLSTLSYELAPLSASFGSQAVRQTLNLNSLLTTNNTTTTNNNIATNPGSFQP